MNEDALLRAICEHPDEDTPRLVLADWLQEQGGEISIEWAAAIRAQVARATGETDVPEPQLFNSQSGTDRVSERLGLPAGIETSRWERGFPTCMFGSFDAIRAAWPGLIARVPFRDLRVSESSDDTVTDFVTWPELDRLTALDLRSWHRGGERGPVRRTGASRGGRAPRPFGPRVTENELPTAH